MHPARFGYPRPQSTEEVLGALSGSDPSVGLGRLPLVPQHVWRQIDEQVGALSMQSLGGAPPWVGLGRLQTLGLVRRLPCG